MSPQVCQSSDKCVHAEQCNSTHVLPQRCRIWSAWCSDRQVEFLDPTGNTVTPIIWTPPPNVYCTIATSVKAVKKPAIKLGGPKNINKRKEFVHAQQIFAELHIKRPTSITELMQLVGSLQSYQTHEFNYIVRRPKVILFNMMETILSFQPSLQQKISKLRVLILCDGIDTVKARILYFNSKARKRFSALLIRLAWTNVCSTHYLIF
jgi:hypothetical protein